jgi:hypothetical protein
MKSNKSNDAEMHDQELGVCTLLKRHLYSGPMGGLFYAMLH